MDITCDLCPRFCKLAPGKRGNCNIRMNKDGSIIPLTYGKPCAVNIDPIEKKPMFHFKPGSDILSIATAGCNLHCKNCQNWDISQARPEDIDTYNLPPDLLITKAGELNISSIAYTYTEPLVYYEYTYDSSVLAREKGISNILVSAGYINEPPLKKLLPFIDGANFDLKSMSESFYRDICQASLKPVLKTLAIAKEMDIIIEITNLLIPGLNDQDEDIIKLVSWIKENLGLETPIHFSAFYPRYKLENIPPTSSKTLIKAREIALAEGFKYIYTGNIHIKGGENTYCLSCGTTLIERSGFKILNNRLINGYCPECSTEQYGRWS